MKMTCVTCGTEPASFQYGNDRYCAEHWLAFVTERQPSVPGWKPTLRKKIDDVIAAISAYGGDDPMFQWLLGEIDIAVDGIVQCPHALLGGSHDGTIVCQNCGRAHTYEPDPDWGQEDKHAHQADAG